MTDRLALARRVLVASLVVLAVFGLAYLVVKVGFVLLLAFGGILLAVLLDGMTRWICEKTGWGRSWALALVAVVLVGAFVALVLLLGPRVVAQFGQLGTALGEGQDRILEALAGVEWAQPILDRIAAFQSNSQEIAQRVLGAFSTVVGGLINIVVILFIGAYLVADPGLYQRGLLHLVDKRHRQRGAEVLTRTGTALRGWLVGQFISMTIVGVLTTIGLLILGVPLALTLGLIAFLFSFVPYIGPIASFIPAVLVALVESPQLALYTLGLYGVVQFAESYLVTPMVQKRVVSLPPALLIFAEILLGALAGVLGIALSVPMSVAVVVIVQMLYVEDVLDDHTVHVLGSDDGKEEHHDDEIDDALREAERTT